MNKLTVSGPGKVDEWVIFYNNVGICNVFHEEITESDHPKNLHFFRILINTSLDQPDNDKLFEYIKREIITKISKDFIFSFIYTNFTGNVNFSDKPELFNWGK